MILFRATVTIALLALCFTLITGEDLPENPPDAEKETTETKAEGGESAATEIKKTDDAETASIGEKEPKQSDQTEPGSPAEGEQKDTVNVSELKTDTVNVPETKTAGDAASKVPCGVIDFLPPPLTPVEDAACFFAKNGWFPPEATKLDMKELLAELTTLLGPDAAALTPELGLSLLKKCYNSFKPLPMDVLNKNRGGFSSDLFGGKQGFDIDLFSLTKTCPSVISSLTSVRTGGVTAPVEVVKLCISYFGNEVIENILSQYIKH